MSQPTEITQFIFGRPLSDLVDTGAIKQGSRYLIERSGGQKTTAIYDFASALKAVARYHLRVDQAHLDQITKIMQKLDPGKKKKRGLTKTNRSRLRQLEDLTNKAALVGLPPRLINLAARNPRSYAGALQAQAAVAIEILLMAPLRIGNLAQLDLEQHLVRPGRGNVLHLVLEPEDVKNDEPLEYSLPLESVALIERYLQEFRPRLAALHCTALFPGRNGGGKSVNALRDLITRTVHRYTGMRMHPHLFRHAGAKLFLDTNPGQYEVVRRVLGHRSLNTTTIFYTGLETTSAVRHYDETILRQRRTPSK